MPDYELNNEERKYFGLRPVLESWDRKFLSPDFSVYFDDTRIIKIIEGDNGYAYREIDVDINTINREIIVPKTNRRKEQKITLKRFQKIKGSGIEFTISFQGGGINAYDHRRNIFVVSSYAEEGNITNLDEARNWIAKYIQESPSDYFLWLENELTRKKVRNKARMGDIFAFSAGRKEYAFAQIILCNYKSEHLVANGSEVYKSNLFMNPLLIKIFTAVSTSLQLDLETLIESPALEPIEISDHNVRNGQFPIIGFKSATAKDSSEIRLFELANYLTIPVSKTDILNRDSKWQKRVR